MKLTVEFLGISRVLAQAKESLVEVDDQATLRDVLRALASRYPALVGPVIEPQTYCLAPSYMLNINGRQVVRDLATRQQDGQHLLLMFVEAGG